MMIKLVCNRCRTLLSVPADALAGKDVSGLKCAFCEGPMEVEREPVHQGDDLTPLQLITTGGRKVLVAIADKTLAERVAEAISGGDWHVVLAQTAASALSRLENAQYDVVVLYGKSVPSNLPEDPLLRALQQLPMSERRAFSLCLLCDETATLDYMAAFRAGVDLVVNLQDVAQLRRILDHMLRQHEASYAMFEEELRRKGTPVV